MSKKYKGKKCVYCDDGLSVTGDHVFAREFFLLKERENLPIVPACAECNNKKSVIEHYLTSVLPFGGMHEHAKENLSTMVPKRLSKNKKVHEVLRAEMTYMESKGSRNMLLPINGEAVTELFKYVVKGLSWFHWDTIIDKTSFVFAVALTEAGKRFFHEYFFALQAKKRIENTIGGNAFSYIGVQGIDTNQITVWQFRVYAGIKLADRSTLDSCSDSIGVITGPSNLEHKIISAFNISRGERKKTVG